MIIISPRKLKMFAKNVFIKLNVSEKDAEITADVLVAADLRGIESHGVARLGRYVSRLEKKLIASKTTLRTLNETPATLFIDGGNGLGQAVSYRAMQLAIKKAKHTGMAFVTVRNSNHYGIAGYYAMMALPHNMIGISLTNSRPLCVPTYGREPIIGTNPIGFAAPAFKESPFVLDMATSVISIGKIELAKRKGIKIPLGWAMDKRGLLTDNPAAVLAGGGVLPLGGTAKFSGYKGYGLSAMIDILCGVLTGSSFLSLIEKEISGKPSPSNLGHFFGAINIKSFRPVRQFQKTMDIFIRALKNSSKAKGHKRIFVAGEKEFETEKNRRKNGIPLDKNILTSLQEIGCNVGVKLPF